MSKPLVNPRRGEVWIVDCDPQVGDEIQKVRPAVVIGQNKLCKLRVRIIVPMTTWQLDFQDELLKIRVHPNRQNGLSCESAADCLHMKSVSVERFIKKVGVLTTKQLDNIAAAIALSVGYNA